jgi:cytochrome c
VRSERWWSGSRSRRTLRLGLGRALVTCIRFRKVRAGIVVLAVLGGCGEPQTSLAVPGGNPRKGKAQLAAFGCGSCHLIPGVDHAYGMVGPPLTKFALRPYIAGEVTNNPSNLVQWIMTPQSIEPGTAMLNLGVTEAQARDIAAYLYTLR